MSGPFDLPRTMQPGAAVRPNARFAPSALWAGSASADSVSGLPVLFGQGGSRTVSRGAVALRASGFGLGRVALRSAASADMPGAGDFTVFISFTLLGTVNGYAVIGRWNTGGALATCDWFLGSLTGLSGGQVDFSVAVGATIYTASIAAGWVPGVRYTLCARRRDTTIGVDRYTDGLSRISGSTTNAGITTINSNAARSLKLGEIDIGEGYSANLDASLVAIFPRAISDAEMGAIVGNQWQLFAPVARPIFVGLGGAPVDPGFITGVISQLTNPSTLSTPTGTVTRDGAVASLSTDVTLSAPAGTVTRVGTAALLSASATLTAPAATVTRAATVAPMTAGSTLSEPAATGALEGATAPLSAAAVLSAPAGTQAHVGDAAPALASSTATTPAGSQVHVGAVSGMTAIATVSDVASGSTQGATAPMSAGSSMSTPAGSQTHQGTAQTLNSGASTSTPTGTQTHTGVVPPITSGSTVSDVAQGEFSGASAPLSASSSMSSVTGSQAHTGLTAGMTAERILSAPIGTQIHVGSVNNLTSSRVLSSIAGSIFDPEADTFRYANPLNFTVAPRSRAWRVLVTKSLEKHTTESVIYDVDCTGILGPTETISVIGEPVSEPVGLVFSGQVSNSQTITYPDGRLAVAGKVIQVNISGGSIPGWRRKLDYTLRFPFTTSIPGNTQEATVTLTLKDTP